MIYKAHNYDKNNLLFQDSRDPEAGQAGFDYVEVFRSAQDVVNRIENPIEPPYGGGNGSKLIDNCVLNPSFCGVSKKEDALELLKWGWGRGAELIRTANIEFESLQQEIEAFAPSYDVAGSMVDVAAYLNGDPDCMITPSLEFQATQGVRIVSNMAVSGQVNIKSMITKGIAMSALVSTLFILGIPTEVWVAETTYHFGSRTAVFFKAKEAQDYLDLEKLAFYTAHPAMSRVISWWVIDKSYQAIQRANDIYGGRGRPEKLYPEMFFRSESFKTIPFDSMFKSMTPDKVIEQIKTLLNSLGINLKVVA